MSKIGLFHKFYSFKNIISLFFSLFLLGCEGRECLNDNNKNALNLILENLDATYTWACFFSRYDVNIYGLNNKTDIDLFFKNLDNVKKLDNVNMKIYAYNEKQEFECKNYDNGIKSCRLKLEKPFFKIKINNTRR